MSLLTKDEYVSNEIKIAAGVVIFKPDENRLLNCIKNLNNQVEHIYIYDNSEEFNNYKNKFQDYNISYITKGKNLGISHALNCIMNQAMRDGYNWVITMDQDSIIPIGMIEDFAQSILSHPEAGIICPQVIDKRRAYMEVKNSKVEEYVNFCITSASCTSIKAWEKCGKFDEWLFIDLVDNDFCKRLILTGYKILRLNKWIMDQQFGNIIPKDKIIQNFWIKISKVLHNQNLAKLSYKKNVDPLRVYYTNRNIIYLNKKMIRYGNTGYENYNCKTYFGFIFCFMIPSILRSENKIKTIKATNKGIKDGIISNPKVWISYKEEGL